MTIDKKLTNEEQEQKLNFEVDMARERFLSCIVYDYCPGLVESSRSIYLKKIDEHRQFIEKKFSSIYK